MSRIGCPTTYILPWLQDMKKTKLRMSKSIDGNGERSNQSDSFENEELHEMFRREVITTSSGIGILRGLFVYMMCVAQNRSLKDNLTMTWGMVKVCIRF